MKRLLLAAIVGCVLIQAVRPKKNVSATPPGPDDFIAHFSPPAALAQQLRVACYDCHSDNTRYPWYAELQPVGWWLATHIHDGKRHLNLSTFASLTPKLQAKKLSQMSDQITNREMPMASYTWIHRDARLTDAEVDALSAWLDDVHDKIAGAE